MAVALMKKMKEEGFPLRPHFFWPLFTHHQKDKNIPGLLAPVYSSPERQEHSW